MANLKAMKNGTEAVAIATNELDVDNSILSRNIANGNVNNSAQRIAAALHLTC